MNSSISADADSGIDQHTDDGPVAQSDKRLDVDVREQLPDLGDTQGWRAAFDNAVARSADGCGRIEGNRVPQHEVIEEVPQRRQMELARRLGQRLTTPVPQSTEVLTDEPRADLLECNITLPAPIEQAIDGVPIGASRVWILDGGLEKLLIGEACTRPSVQ